MPNEPAVAADPWLDEHAQVDFAAHPEDKTETLLESVTAIANEPGADPLEVLSGIPDDTPPAPAVQPPAPAEPEVMDLGDGSTVTIEETKRGLKATLDSATNAKVEVFYGKDRDELLRNVLVGKLNATKKINELTRKSKTGGGKPVAAPTSAALPDNELTADQKFEIKTAADSGDMAKALELTMQYKYGRNLKDIVVGAEHGQVAKSELDTEGVARAFIAANPDYYNATENYHMILGWLSNQTGGPELAEDASNVDQVMQWISDGNYWTVQNLQRAYDELRDVMIAPPGLEPDEQDQPADPPPPAVRRATPANPAPQSGRIVREVRRPRAGQGIRPSAASGAQPDAVNVPAPSVDELDNLSDAELDKLYSATTRYVRQQSARR